MSQTLRSWQISFWVLMTVYIRFDRSWSLNVVTEDGKHGNSLNCIYARMKMMMMMFCSCVRPRRDNIFSASHLQPYSGCPLLSLIISLYSAAAQTVSSGVIQGTVAGHSGQGHYLFNRYKNSIRRYSPACPGNIQ